MYLTHTLQTFSSLQCTRSTTVVLQCGRTASASARHGEHEMSVPREAAATDALTARADTTERAVKRLSNELASVTNALQTRSADAARLTEAHTALVARAAADTVDAAREVEVATLKALAQADELTLLFPALEALAREGRRRSPRAFRAGDRCRQTRSPVACRLPAKWSRCEFGVTDVCIGAGW